jgi:sirohydrochlorin ferrochelatase
MPLVSVGNSANIPTGATRLEVVATISDIRLSSAVDVHVSDVCGSFTGFDPVFTQLVVQQGGIVVNGNVYSLNPLADGKSVMLDVGASMGEGNANVITLMGQGAAGASATVTIGDQSIVTTATGLAIVTTGDEAQRILELVAAGDSPTVKIATSGDKLIVSWSDLWDGFQVQSCASLASGEQWVTVPVTPVLSNGQFSVTLPPNSGKFVRLFKP